MSKVVEKSRRGLVTVIGVGLALLIAGCASLRLRDEGLVLARVNGIPLTLEQAREEFRTIHRGHLSFIGGEKELTNFVVRMVERRLLIEEGYRIGFHQGEDIREYLEQFRFERIRQAFYNDRVTSKVRVTDEEVEALRLQMSEQVRLRLILVATGVDAEQVKNRLSLGEEFGQLARNYSRGPASEKGGDLGFVARGMVDEEVEAVAFSMGEGEVRGPFSVAAGHAFVQLLAKKRVEAPPLAKVKPLLLRALAARAERRLRRELLDQLRADAGAKVNQALLKALIVPEGEPGTASRPGPSQLGEEVLATLYGKAIPFKEFSRPINTENLRRLPPEAALELLERRLKEFLDERLLLAAAEQEGYGKGVDIQKAVRQEEEGIVLGRLQVQAMQPNIVVTDEEVRAAYEKNQERYVIAEQVRISHVLLDSEEEALKVLELIKGGVAFDKLAWQYSKDQGTAARGGEIGWIVISSFLPVFREEVSALGVGEVAGPLKGEDGFHLITVLDKRGKMTLPFSQVRERVKLKVIRERRDEIRRQWVEKLKAQASIEINRDAIREASVILSEEAARRLEERKGGPTTTN